MNSVNHSLSLPLIFSVAALAVWYFASRKTVWKRLSGSHPALRAAKYISFFIAFFLATLAFVDIGTRVKVANVRYLFVFDITPSQMVEDYTDNDGKPISRLQAAKNFFMAELDYLPRNSEVAVAALNGDMGEVMIFLPLTPAVNKGEIRNGLELVQWWNAWTHGSGLQYLHIRIHNMVQKWGGKLNVVVMTDGGDTSIYAEHYEVSAEVKEFLADMRFLLIGVGKTSASDVPKYDKTGKKAGCLKSVGDSCYRSALNAKSLAGSAATFNGKYLNIENGDLIRNWLTSEVLVRPNSAEVRTSLAWIAALGSLALFVVWSRL